MFHFVSVIVKDEAREQISDRAGGAGTVRAIWCGVRKIQARRQALVVATQCLSG